MSPDGHWIVTTSRNNTVRLWDLTAGAPASSPLELRGSGKGVASIAISQDSRWLVTGDLASTAHLYDLTAEDPAASVRELRHGGWIMSVAISPDSHWLVTGSSDDAARLWDLTSEDPATSSVKLGVHTANLNSVAMSPNSRWAVTGGDDGTARVWDLAAENPASSPLVLRGHEATVWSIVPTSTGFVAEFNRELDTSTLNLYDTLTAELGFADVSLVGSNGSVPGSLIVDPSLKRIQFVKTGGPLLADDYTVTLRSAANGFRDVAGNVLSGDDDDLSGGDFVTSFSVAPSSARTATLSLPDVVRGPGQPVNLPADTTMGIPLTISGPAGVRAINLEISYDPSVVRLADLVVGPDMHEDASVSVTIPARDEASIVADPTRRVISVMFSSPTDLPAGSSTFADVKLMVLPTVEYNRELGAQLLDVDAVVIRDGDDESLPVLVDDSIHLANHFGDVSGNERINASDAAQVARVAALIDSGFAGSLLTDPVLMGDITGNGRINASDAARVARAAAQLQVPEIPAVPPEASLVFDTAAELPEKHAATGVSDALWPFHRFVIAAPTKMVSVGGHFRYDGRDLVKLFAAVVQLSGPDDNPDSFDLTTSDLVGTTLVSLTRTGSEGQTFTGSFDELLAPGWYALVFGTGAFGASPNSGDHETSDPIFMPYHAMDLAPTQSPSWMIRTPPNRLVTKDRNPRFFATAATPTNSPLGTGDNASVRVGVPTGQIAMPTMPMSSDAIAHVELVRSLPIPSSWPAAVDNTRPTHPVDVFLTEGSVSNSSISTGDEPLIPVLDDVIEELCAKT